MLAGISDASASQLYTSLINPTLFPSMASKFVWISQFTLDRYLRLLLHCFHRETKVAQAPVGPILFTSDASGRSSEMPEAAAHPCSYVFRMGRYPVQ